MPTIDVLDHGFVRFNEDGVIGTELGVYNVARISHDKGPSAGVSNETLHRFFKSLLCRDPAHESPFEFASLRVEIKAPIFVARQLHRHRVTSIMERSLRYNEAVPEYYTPELDSYTWQEYEFIMQNQISSYETLLELGVPKEQARGVLGTAFYTQWYLQANLREIMHILNIRTDSAAQWETRQFAEAIKAVFCVTFPNVFDAWQDSIVEKRSR